MFKNIYNRIILFKEKKDLKKKAKDWSFKNEYQFLKYCDSINENNLIKSYEKILEIKNIESVPLERKIKPTNASSTKAINAKHLKIMMEIVSKNNINDMKMLDEDILYKEIVKYFIERCKKDENEKCDYIDLFREMYSFDLETSTKIKILISKYLTSLGINK